MRAPAGPPHPRRESGLRFDLMYVSLSATDPRYAGDRLLRLARARPRWQEQAHEPPGSFFPHRMALVAWELAARSGLWSPLLFPSLAEDRYELALLSRPTAMEAWHSLYGRSAVLPWGGRGS